MPRRIEIELTSARPDGSWTWRAAGAKEPRGILDGSLLFDAAKPGDVLKAEADFELEGITIISVTAPKADSKPGPQRIELLGPSRPEVPGVTTQLVGRSDRRSGDRRRERDDERGGRRERSPGRPQGPRDTGRPRREGPERSETDEQGQRRAGPARDAGHDRTRDPGRGRAGDRPPSDRLADQRPPSDRQADQSRRDRRTPAERPAPEPARPKARRLNPASTHRQAVLESLPPEQQPIAEQVLRGGIPAVRTALHLEREKAESEGRAAPNTDELVAMAEALLPKLKAAEWRDRAEAAAADLDATSLRDLRSVVAGADQARDEETRALAARLREALEVRIRSLHDEWTADITKQLDENHLVRAIRLSARPPEPAARLGPELSQRLADAAGAAMSPEASADRWMALLDATAVSPIRRNVRPVGLPADAPADLKRAAHQHSGAIPALAALLGVAIPPPPLPVAGAKKGATRRSAAPRPPGRAPTPSSKQRAVTAEPQATGTIATATPAPQTAPPAEPEPTAAEPEAATPAEPEAATPAEPEAATPAQPEPEIAATEFDQAGI